MKPTLKYSAALAALTMATPACTPEKEKPVNFVLVYLDDMGYGDLTLTGATGFKTPNLDKMANEGIFFTQFYSPQAVCSASRAGLLTGCYPNRVGFSGAIDHMAKIGLSPEEETIATILKKRGYATAAYGKWHLGHVPDFLPLMHGFDEFLGIPYSNDMWPYHPTSKNYYPPLPLIEGDSVVETNSDQSQFTTMFTERTVDFIKRNRNNPFFVYLAHPMPHVPLFVSEKFAGKSEQGLYGDVMMELDWSMGQINDVLDELDLSQNTLVVFTSDNGPWLNYGNHAGSSGGLREGKGCTFEGGQRVPCLMRWKGVISEGVVNNQLIAGMDILPTFAEIAGAPLPEKTIDGVSFLPLLKGEEGANPRKTFLYYYRRNNLEAVRYGNWKLMFPHRGRTYAGFEPGKDGSPGGTIEFFEREAALFDLRRDPGEQYNVIEFYPEIVDQITKIADVAREDLGDDLTGNPGKNRREPGRIKELAE
jgi:arylsulfatase